MRVRVLCFFILITLLFCKKIAWAQTAERGITGTIVDPQSNQPVAFATIGLFETGSTTPLKGATSDENGNFSFDEIEEGNYSVKIQFIGYEDQQIDNIAITQTRPLARLGAIRLKGTNQQLSEVEIVEAPDVAQSGLGSRTYDVSQDIMTAGGNASDVLQNIPSVQVDENGTLSLRGSSNVTVLINGKQSGLTGLGRQAILDRIPASAIERIEVLTNPSAKYDPDGGAGIINIILKEKQEDGLNGSAGINIGINDRYNSNLELNWRKGSWNFYGGLNANQRAREGEITINRQNFLSDATPFIDQENDNSRRNIALSSNFGIAYNINDKQTLTLEGVLGYDIGERSEEQLNENFDINRNLLDFDIRNAWEDEDDRNQTYSLAYDIKFNKPNQELNLFGSYAFARDYEEEDFIQNTFMADGTLVPLAEQLQRSTNDENTAMLILQADYTHPISEQLRIETGWKTIVRNIDTDFQLEEFDQATNQWENQVGFTNRFDYDEAVHAGYLLTGGKLNRLEFEAGLRFETTNTTSSLITTNETFNFDYVNFFPSGVLTYSLPKDQKVQASYSRRINRPSFWDLNPFPTFSNPLVLRGGDPLLQPEYTDSYELGFIKDWNNASLTSSAFYKRTTGVIQRIVSQVSGDTTIYRPTNVSTAENYGVELIGSYSVGKWLNMNANVSYFRLVIDGSNSDELTTNDSYSWNTRFMANINLPRSFRIQMMLYYRAPMINAQGERLDFFMNSLGISKSVMKRKGRIILNVRDIAQTMRFGSIRRTPTLFNEFLYRGNTRSLSIGFNYQFGKQQRRPDRRRGEGERNGGGDDM